MFGLMFGLECLDFKGSSYSQLPGNLSLDCKYLHATQIPQNKAFQPKPDLTVEDILLVYFTITLHITDEYSCFILTHLIVSKLRCSSCSGIYTSHILCRISPG